MITVDFHSHCLPAIDDGAEDVSASLQMLEESVRQGIHTVVATPHFYLGQNTVDTFVAARQQAYVALQKHLTGVPVTLRLGAEVLAREGLSGTDLRPLCIQGTDLLLLELPFLPAPNWLYEEIENIVYGQHLTVVLAHLDRYLPWYSRQGIARIADFPGLVIQLNGEAFTDRRCYRALQHWLPETERLVLGSDMHNPDRRPPTLGKACALLKKKATGRELVQRADACSRELLKL